MRRTARCVCHPFVLVGQQVDQSGSRQVAVACDRTPHRRVGSVTNFCAVVADRSGSRGARHRISGSGSSWRRSGAGSPGEGDVVCRMPHGALSGVTAGRRASRTHHYRNHETNIAWPPTITVGGHATESNPAGEWSTAPTGQPWRPGSTSLACRWCARHSRCPPASPTRCAPHRRTGPTPCRSRSG